jgi:hypothetical protein
MILATPEIRADDGFTLGHAPGFEQFFHARQTGRDVAASGHTAGVEGTQGELRAGLTNRLGCDDADSRAELDHLAPPQVHAIAFGTDAVDQFAGQVASAP